jgi:hypothetical protein
MITEQTTPAGRNQRANAAVGLRWRMTAWIGLASGLVLVAVVLVVSRFAGPLVSFGLAQRADAPLAVAAKEEQPVVGHGAVVTGLVYDGTRYLNAPISAGALADQPTVGRAMTVTGLIYDGTHYLNAPLDVGALEIGRDYAVTALVYDGTTYRTAPVQISGR